MKIGIIGGTFNPIHIGHLILAQDSQITLGLDKVVFIPVNLPALKESVELISAHLRLKMVKIAIKGNPRFAVSSVEIDRGGKSYTIDTLRYFKKRHPNDELYFIVGSDASMSLNKWKDFQEIIEIAHFVVAKRSGFSVDNLPEGVKAIDISQIEVSSSQVRERIKESLPIYYLVPNKVRRYILKKGLYL